MNEAKANVAVQMFLSSLRSLRWKTSSAWTRSKSRAAQRTNERKRTRSIAIPSPFDEPAFLPPNPAELVGLIAAKNYDGALRLLLHLQTYHIPIQRDIIYTEPALHWLKKMRNPGSRFHRWFSLVPDKHEAPHWSSPFHDILSYLIREQSPKDTLTRLKMVMLHASSKGYFHNLYRPFSTIFFRFQPPEQGQNYLLKLERRAVQYEQRVPHSRRHPEARYRALIIRDCCHAGWIQQALNIFYLSGEIRLPEETGQYLLEKVVAMGDEDGERIVRRIMDARSTQFAQKGTIAPEPVLGSIPDDDIPGPFDIAEEP